MRITPEERSAAARRIDPNTWLVWTQWADDLDPFGDDPDHPESGVYNGRARFARDPEEGIAVLESDVRELHPTVDEDRWRQLLQEGAVRGAIWGAIERELWDASINYPGVPEARLRELVQECALRL